MVWEDKIRLVRDEIREGERTDGETPDSLTKFLIIVCFEGGSQSPGITTDGPTDLWWFRKAKAVPPMSIGHSHLPRWRSWVEQGRGVGQKQSAR